MAETPRMGGAGINVLGRAALGGLRFGGRQLRRGVSLAAAPILAPIGQTTAAFAGSELGVITGGVVGLAKNIQKSLFSMLKEMKKRNEKEEKIAREQKVERNKEVSQRLEDIREGKDGDEDPDSGKGTITSRLGKVLKKINAKTRAAAKGLMSKIPGVGFLSSVATKFTSGFVGMAATWVAGWTAAIAVGALILKFIFDNIGDWVQMAVDKILQFFENIPLLNKITKKGILGQSHTDIINKTLDMMKDDPKLSFENALEQASVIKKEELTQRGFSQETSGTVVDEIRKDPKKYITEQIKATDVGIKVANQTREGIIRGGKKESLEARILRETGFGPDMREGSNFYKDRLEDQRRRIEELQARKALLLKLLANARFAGGPVQANEPYMVGEYGPELFIPTVPGFVDNQSTTGDRGFSTPTLSKATPRIEQTGLRTTTASVSAIPPAPSTRSGGDTNIVTGGTVNQTTETTNFASSLTSGVSNPYDQSVNYA